MLITYPLRFLRSNVRRSFNVQSQPFLLNYSITLRCNLDCKYCGVSRLKNNYAAQELDKDDISFFLRDKALKRLRVIVISGGEPFLKEDFNDILLEFQKKVSPEVFHITTNGFLTERIVDSVRFLKKGGLNLEIKVSIDDIKGGQDYLRNKRGSFDKAVETIQKLRSNFRAKELTIGINQTLFEENYKSIREVRKLAESLAVCYIGFVGLKERPLYTGIKGSSYGLVDLSSGAKKQITDELKSVYGRWSYFRNNSRFTEEVIIKHYIRGQIKMIEGKLLKPHKCMSLFTHFRLNPNGDIIACSYDLDILGNIRRESYSSIMRKPQVKEKLREIKSCGKCWLGCEVSPSWVSSLFMP